MDFLQNTQLVLLDFDGLLVNTENLHFQAYQRVCANRGFSLPWDFFTFCSIAHRSSSGLKEKMYHDLPALYALEPSWEVLYQEKKTEYIKLLQEGAIDLMPGVERFLQFLEQNNIKRAVVTNSPKEQIDLIKEKIPSLQTIPLWITREDYKNPKPAPDGYLQALAKLLEPGDKVLGFEDTLRGYLALEAAGVEGIVVSEVLSEEFRAELISRGAKIIPSFATLTF
ncbi:MAG: HAD family phosphatase [Chlamydiae bacterium]|nr:HAD family phosphatase [Chlamydiota bacterium]